MSGVESRGESGVPAVSVGLPVYNGERTIGKAIETYLAQSYVDFELIVSDNASTDGTEAICRSFMEQDSRVRYVRQDINLGAAGNFKHVLTQARGRYFMWAAADDFRSPDFLALNVAVLERRADCVASTSPNCFEGDESNRGTQVNFTLSGDLEARFTGFLKNAWRSHAIFYSLMRTDVIRDCDIPGQTFTASDWAIDFFLASRGQVLRAEGGLTVFGRDGISSREGAWQAFRQQRIEAMLPLYRFSVYALKLTRPLARGARIRVLLELAKLNLHASKDQAHAALYAFYKRHFKKHGSQGAGRSWG